MLVSVLLLLGLRKGKLLVSVSKSNYFTKAYQVGQIAKT